MIMNTWRIHNGKTISGEDLLDAVSSNIQTLRLSYNFSYTSQVTHYKVCYSPSILGGNGGIVVRLIAEYKRSTNGETEKTEFVIWLYGNQEDTEGITDEWFEVSGWGGAREGAGRKPTGRKKKTFYVTDEEYESLQKYLKELRKPRG